MPRLGHGPANTRVVESPEAAVRRAKLGSAPRHRLTAFFGRMSLR